MPRLINGLHHITALASDPQRNVDFYARVLGLRMVKKTINFDAPDVYHLYYGDETGQPGTIMTFFPYAGIRRGRVGSGQVTATLFSIPTDSVDFWTDRLQQHQVSFQAPQTRADETVIILEDHDGLRLELIANNRDSRPGWDNGQIPATHAIRGFYGITICVEDAGPTVELLTELLEYREVEAPEGRIRLEAGDGGPGTVVELWCAPGMERGLSGGGTIHHVAFSTDSDETQQQIRQRLAQAYQNPTAVLDRQYFHSIYFREPGGVLFEVATNPPGFAVDESVEELGTALKLPPWQEVNREIIARALTPIRLP